MSGKDFEHMGRLGAPRTQPTRDAKAAQDEERQAGIREAMAQVRAGQTIPAEDVEAWVESWDTPNELPKPVPRRR
jgi:predicted transcriptional regulator